MDLIKRIKIQTIMTETVKRKRKQRRRKISKLYNMKTWSKTTKAKNIQDGKNLKIV